VTTAVEGVETILAVLEAINGWTVFEGEPVDPPREDDNPSSPVLPYCCLYMGAGVTRSSRHGYRAVDLSLPWQITYAAGTPRGALWAFDKGRAALVGLHLFDGAQHGVVKEDLDPGEVRKDKDVPNDIRWFLPMRYRITTTT
jgi:hypothetical protein